MNDGELVALSLGGDTRAFGELVARHQGSVQGLAYAIVGDWHEAEDLTQEAFLRAHLALGQLREGERFGGWLRRVVVRVAATWLSKHHPERCVSPDDVELLDNIIVAGNADDRIAHAETADELVAAVARLPVHYRAPLTMFYLNGARLDDVAEVLGKPVGTVKSLIHRARELLRGWLPAGQGDGAIELERAFGRHRLRKELAVTVTQIIEAAKNGELPRVKELLAARPELVDAKSEYDKTALHWAAEKNNEELAKLLLAAGADIELTTTWGATALEWAVNMGSRAVAQALLDRGAPRNLFTAAGLGMLQAVQAYFARGRPDPSAGRPARSGDAASHWPADSALQRGDVVSDAFYIACRNGETAVAAFLLEHGAEIDAKGYFGATGLHWAAHNGHLDTVAWLLDRGANPNLRDDKFHATAAGWATENQHFEIARLVVERGAEVDVREAANYGLIDRVRAIIDADPTQVDAPGGWGTALHEAVFFGHRDIVALLLARGADPSKKTCRGETAFDLAQAQNHPEILAMLHR